VRCGFVSYVVMDVDDSYRKMEQLIADADAALQAGSDDFADGHSFVPISSTTSSDSNQPSRPPSSTQQQQQQQQQQQVAQDEEDEVVQELSLFVAKNLDTNHLLYLLQYPLRPSAKPYSAAGSPAVRIKVCATHSTTS
jgi:hypothetical protein